MSAAENTALLQNSTAQPDAYGAVTHIVENQPTDLVDYNLFEADIALRENVALAGGHWAIADLERFGSLIGTAEYLEQGHLANKFQPEFDTHDRHGRRIDQARFHPSYHALLKVAFEEGLHSSPWTDPKAGAHVARAAKFYLQCQVEAGHGCPIAMTFAATRAIQMQPDLASQWLPKVTAWQYDPRNIPAEQKQALTIGMAMTEKQGGSDVRANTTRATPVGSEGPGQAYELVGHKFFVSAPMSDAFLVLAQAPGGLSCFLMPRWRPDGSKNPMQVQRLKKKMGNTSNAAGETELRGALAWMVGPEGKGVSTIIEMVAMTRFDCMILSAGGMRMALSQALYHCRNRTVFGKRLSEQPLMQNVLADLALESEAALSMTLRIARALDERGTAHEDHMARLGTALGKYWICKRTAQHAVEAMECIGGSGFMEDGPMPRLYREAPLNAIWEGCGNVQCLDVIRVFRREPETVAAFFDEVGAVKGQYVPLDQYVDELRNDLADLSDIEYRARDVVDRMAIAFQAAQLLKTSPSFVAEAFCISRIESRGHHQYGALPRGVDVVAIMERALPSQIVSTLGS